MSYEASIFQALRKDEGRTIRKNRNPSRNRRFEEVEPYRPEDDAIAKVEEDDDLENDPLCEEEDPVTCPVCGKKPCVCESDDDDEDDPLADPVNEGDEDDDDEDGDDPVVDTYNEDTVKLLGSMLERAHAPAAILKAYEMKLYERCAKWLENKKGMKVDLREGFSKKESRRIRKRLNEMKAPAYVRKAFEGGQYSIVSSFFRMKKGR